MVIHSVDFSGYGGVLCLFISDTWQAGIAMRPLVCTLGALLLAGPLLAQDAAMAHGDPVLEGATLHCIGFHWLVDGDANANARVDLSLRMAGDGTWHQGPSLLRNERRTTRYLDQGGVPRTSLLEIPDGGELFAGSAVMLTPDTAYEFKLTLRDPDGGSAQCVLHGRTAVEPQADPAAPVRHVVPGDGGGRGTLADPFKGLAAAQHAAKAGDHFLLHAGGYVHGTWMITRSGEPGKPIIWDGEGDGEVVIDGGRSLDHLEGSVIKADGAHDVWFEGLSIRNAYNAIRAHGADRLVIRRCRLTGLICGIVATSADAQHAQSGWFITDNLIVGQQSWPKTAAEYEAGPESRGVWITGSGHVIAWNRVHNVKDGIDVGDGVRCDNIDIHNNDISECFDDGSELDGSERNVRCFENRYTDVLVGVSFQPIYGGPAYAFRNVIYNIRGEPMKLHNAPSGAVIYHNTAVRFGAPALLSTQDSPVNCLSRNNLFVGTAGRAYHSDPLMIHCDFDYDGFAGYSGEVFMKWCGVKYATLAAVIAQAPVYHHAVALSAAGLFASGQAAPTADGLLFDPAKLDLRLSPGCAAIDAGEVLPGFNDGYAGKGPDLGAYELGSALPHYGIRPEAMGKR
jgi:hypothetical protein